MWNKKTLDYETNYMSAQKPDVFDYEIAINTPSVLKMCPRDAINVLELGSGIGIFTEELARRYRKVLATDSSGKMLAVLHDRTPKIEVKKLNMELPFLITKKFDLIVAKLVLMYVKNIDNVAKESFELLNKGGCLVISVTHPIRWFKVYILNKYDIKPEDTYRSLGNGYFTESVITKRIGGKDTLECEFINRTLATYVNTFTKYGFMLSEIDEPVITQNFLNRHPKYSQIIDYPLRLNLKFLK